MKLPNSRSMHNHQTPYTIGGLILTWRVHQHRFLLTGSTHTGLQYKFDGFRFDFTKGFTNTPGDGMAYDPSRIAILERMADQIWKVKPDAYVILEHFYNQQ